MEETNLIVNLMKIPVSLWPILSFARQYNSIYLVRFFFVSLSTGKQVHTLWLMQKWQFEHI